MKRKQSLIGGLDRILSVREASDLLSIPADELLKFYSDQREITLSNLLRRICRSNPIYKFPIIGEPTYTLQGVMHATGKARSWSLFFLERNCVRSWCMGFHYLYSKADVDNAWRKESIMWDEWIPLLQVSFFMASWGRTQGPPVELQPGAEAIPTSISRESARWMAYEKASFQSSCRYRTRSWTG